MKRIQSVLFLSPLTLSAFADYANGLNAISQQTPSVASYIPFVQVVCYAIFGSTNKDKNHNQKQNTVTVINHKTSGRFDKDKNCTCKRFVEDPLTKESMSRNH